MALAFGRSLLYFRRSKDSDALLLQRVEWATFWPRRAVTPYTTSAPLYDIRYHLTSSSRIGIVARDSGPVTSPSVPGTHCVLCVDVRGVHAPPLRH